MEFEAMAVMVGVMDVQENGEKTICGIHMDCTVCPNCPALCEVCAFDCTTKGQFCPGKGQP